jgi:hypothetical protein
MRRFLVLGLFCLLAVTACSNPSGADTSLPDGTTEAVDSTVATETTTTTLVVDTTTTTRPECPYNEGGSCLGALDAGTYRTVVFKPAFSYSVGDGWINHEDLPGNFLLQMKGEVRYLGIYANPLIPLECDENRDPAVGKSVADLVGWYTAHPGLVSSEPEDVTVGGLEGIFLDLYLDPSWAVTCPFSNGQPIVPILIGNGVSSLHHTIPAGYEVGLYILDWNGAGTVVIEVSPEGPGLADYLDEVSPIIDSIVFG